MNPLVNLCYVWNRDLLLLKSLLLLTLKKLILKKGFVFFKHLRSLLYQLPV